MSDPGNDRTPGQGGCGGTNGSVRNRSRAPSDTSPPDGCVLAAARRYIARGWAVVPIPHSTKAPKIRRWQDLRLTEGDLARHFGHGPMNIGVILGSASGGLLDVDLDAPGAPAAADVLLPATGAVFGRPGKPRSHRFYLNDAGSPRSKRFQTPDLGTIVELRGDGAQTVVPPSVHPSGEPIAWVDEGAPARVDLHELQRGVARVAAATVLAEGWTEHKRHDAALALAGWLLRCGWSEEDCRAFVRAVAEAAGDDEAADRVAAVASTRAAIDADDRNVTGRAKLAELLGLERVKRAGGWLGLRGGGSAAHVALGECPYRQSQAGIVWEKPGRDGPVPVGLTNFCARIVADTALDDGAEVRRLFSIEASLGDNTRRFDVPAERFTSMNWATEHLGAGAIIYPGFGARDHARCAIQMFSDAIEPRTIYAHLGWRRIGDRWTYLHAGGAIDAGGAVAGIEVQPPDALGGFALPAPADDPDSLEAAVSASVGLLDLGPPMIMFPLVASIWRAALGGADFSLHVAGATGTFKTELAALAQQHWGSGLDARHLPANWASTANAIAELAFGCKDALLVVDDFAPAGSAYDVARLHALADRVIRGAGNNAGRARLRSDATLRPTRPPRALILSTGEDVPRGASLRARLLVLELSPGDIDPAKLCVCQRHACRGLYAQTMSAFVRWVAVDYEKIQSEFRRRALELRDKATRSSGHRRTPAIVGQLQAALDLFFRFAVEATASEALTEPEARELSERCWAALGQVAESQAQHVGTDDPARRFIELLGSAIASGLAHVADAEPTTNGVDVPERPEAWGWRPGERVTGEQCWRPQGARVGWVAGEGLFLDPEAALRAADRAAGDGHPIGVSARTLGKRLAEGGVLATHDPGRATTRRTLAGARRRVLHLRPGCMCAQVGQSGHSPDSGAAEADCGPVSWPGNERAGGTSGPPDRATIPDSGSPGAIRREDGPVGPIGPVRPAQGLGFSGEHAPEPDADSEWGEL